MHTEKQANSLWCPMVRHQGETGASFNRSRNDRNPTNSDTPATLEAHRGKFGCHCIASQCAMWRFAGDPPAPRRMMTRRVGYCGLAGRPGSAA